MSTTFDSFGLAEPILRAVTELGYREPTPIQAQAIPIVMQGRDVMGAAHGARTSGTWKVVKMLIPKEAKAAFMFTKVRLRMLYLYFYAWQYEYAVIGTTDKSEYTAGIYDPHGDGANDIIYFGAVGHARSNDSGNTFTALAGLHADNHSWAFFPQPSPTPSIVFCGNDGGLYRSNDGGATWTPLSAGGLQTGLFYNLDMRPDATGSNNVGALQDNGTQTRVGATGRGWVAAQGGDGWDVVYDGTIAGRVYCTSGFWSPAPCTRIWRSTDDGASFPTEITPWGTASDAGCYLGPLATDPGAGGILYASGSQNLWQSRDGGGTWRILSPFAGTGDVDVARRKSAGK